MKNHLSSVWSTTLYPSQPFDFHDPSAMKLGSGPMCPNSNPKPTGAGRTTEASAAWTPSPGVRLAACFFPWAWEKTFRGRGFLRFSMCVVNIGHSRKHKFKNRTWDLAGNISCGEASHIHSQLQLGGRDGFNLSESNTAWVQPHFGDRLKQKNSS